MYYTPDTFICLDGDFQPAGAAGCSLYSQSLNYGYAVFEGIRAYQTPTGPQVFEARAHYERLHYSCRAVGLPLRFSVAELIDLTYRLLEVNALSNAYIRPLVYAAEPNMGFTAPLHPTVFIAAWEAAKFLGDQLLRLTISPYQRPNPRAVPIEAKVSGHYVNSIIASNEAKSRGYNEALLLDMQGYVAESTGANFFLEKDGELLTAPAGSILSGITRRTIIDLARARGVRVREEFFTPNALQGANGAFLTGTAAEVVGVAAIDDVVFNTPFHQTLGSALAEQYQALVTTAVAI